MLILLSPAKSLNFSESSYRERNFYTDLPVFNIEAESIVASLKTMSPTEFATKLGLSARLSKLNFTRFQNWKTNNLDAKVARHAAFAFDGDVYKKFDVSSLTDIALDFAQKYVRIFSGLYGLLKPYDLIQPYRLEMSSKVFSDEAISLYNFWSDKVTSELQRQCDFLFGKKSPFIINLASKEYFKILNLRNIKAKIVTPVFQDYVSGRYKVIGFNAKRARGKMARFICMNACENLEQLKFFNWEQYSFNEDVSSSEIWVFRRRLS